jgi:hypothetical protein
MVIEPEGSPPLITGLLNGHDLEPAQFISHSDVLLYLDQYHCCPSAFGLPSEGFARYFPIRSLYELLSFPSWLHD